MRDPIRMPIARTPSRPIGLETKDLPMDHPDVATGRIAHQPISATRPVVTATS
jgi:hypothetical protein